MTHLGLSGHQKTSSHSVTLPVKDRNVKYLVSQSCSFHCLLQSNANNVKRLSSSVIISLMTWWRTALLLPSFPHFCPPPFVSPQQDEGPSLSSHRAERLDWRMGSPSWHRSVAPSSFLIVPRWPPESDRRLQNHLLPVAAKNSSSVTADSLAPRLPYLVLNYIITLQKSHLCFCIAARLLLLSQNKIAI